MKTTRNYKRTPKSRLRSDKEELLLKKMSTNGMGP